MSLQEYREKRNFKKTSEPRGVKLSSKDKKIFVIQKHHASHLHYDFRLELDGVLKSWAVPKGPSLNPADKRLAVEVEDHPMDYAYFEGEIPADEYGGGHVIVWDAGEWVPSKTALADYKKGRLEFELKGKKLQGKWVLVRTQSRAKGKKHNWLLIKRHDAAADLDRDVILENKSVISDRTVEDVQENRKPKKMPKAKETTLMEEPMQEKKPAVKKTALKKTKMFSFEEPQLATLVDTPPVGPNWIHEIKYDGYRTLCRKVGKNVVMQTRSGLDWSKKYPEIAVDCLNLDADSFVMDGEVAWIDDKGHSQFEGLQEAISLAKTTELVYYVFDLLYLDGIDLRESPLLERKSQLEKLLQKGSSKRIIYSPHWTENGASVVKSACGHDLEGIVSKDGEARYESGRSRSWLKTKCRHLQEFVIGGYTLQDNRSLGALLVGGYEEGKLHYAGKVGTGFNRQAERLIMEQLKKYPAKETPFHDKNFGRQEIFWLKPQLVANIEFSNMTHDRILRHAAYKGLREDKKAKDVSLMEVKMEKSEATVAKSEGPQKAMPAKAKSLVKVTSNNESKTSKFKLTHPDKILFPQEKITKQDLADYYASIQKFVLPFVVERPLSLLRCPNGEGKTCFFQKHVENASSAVLEKNISAPLHKKKEAVTYIDSMQGLHELVQMGTLEIHVRGGDIHKPDYANLIVFDLDPDPGVTFKVVKEAAEELNEMLTRLKLKSFIKVSGGKGLHIHVPIAPEYTWDEIKNFSKSVCDQLVKQYPEKYTTNILKKNRKGKIFLDYLRNGYGATAVATYSVRAKPNAPVALPIAWSELGKLKAPDQFTLKNVPAILKKRKDPWEGYFKVKQRIKVLDQSKK